MRMHNACFQSDYYSVIHMSLLSLVLLDEIPAFVSGLTGSEASWLFRQPGSNIYLQVTWRT